MPLSRRFVLAGALAFISMKGRAHRARVTLTTIEHNRNTGLLEVVHRLHVHDALGALGRIDAEASPDLSVPRNQAQIALEVDRYFSLEGSDGPIDLNLLGAELEGDALYVYQEAPLERMPERLTINCALLRRHFADTGNQVNVTFDTGVQSVFFRGEDGAKVVNAGP